MNVSLVCNLFIYYFEISKYAYINIILNFENL